MSNIAFRRSLAVDDFVAGALLIGVFLWLGWKSGLAATILSAKRLNLSMAMMLQRSMKHQTPAGLSRMLTASTAPEGTSVPVMP